MHKEKKVNTKFKDQKKMKFSLVTLGLIGAHV